MFSKEYVLKMAENMLSKANINNSSVYAKDLFIFKFGENIRQINEVALQEYLLLVNRKINGEPIERIIGETEFYGAKFKYSDNTLTPRQETEVLVDMIAKENPKGLKLLDMCAGSGCIGISLALSQNYDVTLCDISKYAIENQKENMLLNNVFCKIIESDLFENISEKYDIIVSNPPYIKSSVIKNLEKEVLKYDPILALDGGEDGMMFYTKIIDDAYKYLNENGKLYLEIDNGLEIKIKNLLDKHYDNVRILKDFSGNYRFAIANNRRVWW